MQIRFDSTRPAGTYALALPVATGQVLEGVAREAAALARFDGEAGTVFETFSGQNGAEESGAVRRVLRVGIGKGAPDAATLEKAGGAVAARIATSGETQLVIDLSGAGLPESAQAAAQLALGALLRSWRYDLYRTRLPEKSRLSLKEVVIVGGGEGAQAAWDALAPVARGVAFTRELVTEPANIIYPESFVERARKALDGLGVEITVLGEEEMLAAGMGALMGVSQGSARAGQLLVMRWNGTGEAGDPPLALVGKGVTFDTGGISIKPAAGMEDMKWDMGGAGAVAGAMVALAARKAKVNVVGVCGLVENMPSGKAQRPGDVVTSMNGQTIEVINTDAEGRLVLCDAIAWVQKHHRPKTIVDLATLTGAIIVSLGHEHGGCFSNDDALADALIAAGKAVGEKLWRMPLGEAYDKLIDSPIADMKNVGPREAGSITAAQFIKRFVDEGVTWAHLDIAGMVWAAKPGPTWEKGATGYGVRLLDRFVRERYEHQSPPG